MSTEVATIERTDTLDELLDEFQKFIDHCRAGMLPEDNPLPDFSKRFTKRWKLMRQAESTSGRRTQAQKLARMLSVQAGVEVTAPYDKREKTYWVTWTDGPDEDGMRQLVAWLAHEVPALDVDEDLSYDHCTTPEPPKVEVVPAKPAAEPAPVVEPPKPDAEPKAPGSNGQPVDPPAAAERASGGRIREDAPVLPRGACPPLFPEPPVRRDDVVHREPRPSGPRERTWRSRFWQALGPVGLVLAFFVAAVVAGAGIWDRTEDYLNDRVTERTARTVDARLNQCYRALDRADDSIYSYFDGVRAERETTVSTPTRDVRARAESDTYKRYVEAKADCRGTPAPPRAPARGPVTAGTFTVE